MWGPILCCNEALSKGSCDRDAGQEAKSALAIRGEVSTIAQHGTLADNKGTRLGGGQDNGELIDVAQKYGTTPGTASSVFPRLGYAIKLWCPSRKRHYISYDDRGAFYHITNTKTQPT